MVYNELTHTYKYQKGDDYMVVLNNEEENIKLQMLKYEMAKDTLLNHINGLMREFELSHDYNPVEHVKSRIKKEESAITKLLSRGYEPTLENLVLHVHDMVGVRIVCSFLSDVYDIVKLVERSEQFQILEKKDYIREPKNTGYMSYHLRVYVPIYLNGGKELIEAEIQIRTVAMDFWASLDHKIQYKFSGIVPQEVMDEMYKCSLDIKKLDHRMLDLNMTVNSYQKKDR